jgi:RNA polymerase sigma factor (TIGR02999 family)
MNLDVTGLLHRARDGDRAALDELMPVVYEELHRLAVRQLSRERAGHTLQPTALVNEAYIRLFGEQAPDVRNRSHFIGIAARIMRQVLVDHARSRSSQKRSGGIMVSLEDRHVGKDAAAKDPGTDLLMIEDALGRLGAEDQGLVRLIEMRYFGGMTAGEIADVSGESIHVIRHNLRYAQARLRQDLNRDLSAGS